MNNNLELIKINYNDNYFSILIHDKKENIKSWIDCSLIDGYGNSENFKTDELYLDWDFNQNIFHLYDENDLKIKKYQENITNIENIGNFIDEIERDLVKKFLEYIGEE